MMSKIGPNDPDFEIFIPYYGRFDYLLEAYESILKQTSQNWRLTIVDNCSPDLSAKNFFNVIEDPRIRYLRNDYNLGVTGNFNRCIDLAKSDYILLMGADDRLAPDFVESALFLINQFPTCSIYQLGVTIIDQHGNATMTTADRLKKFVKPKVVEQERISSRKALGSLVVGNWLYFPAVVWRTLELKQNKFDPKYSIAQDWDLACRLLLNGGEVAVSSHICFEYRRHDSSISNSVEAISLRFKEEKNILTAVGHQLSALGMYRTRVVASLMPLQRLSQIYFRFKSFWK